MTRSYLFGWSWSVGSFWPNFVRDYPTYRTDNSTHHMLSAYGAFEQTGSKEKADETRRLVMAYLRSIETPSESIRKVESMFEERSLKSGHAASAKPARARTQISRIQRKGEFHAS